MPTSSSFTSLALVSIISTCHQRAKVRTRMEITYFGHFVLAHTTRQVAEHFYGPNKAPIAHVFFMFRKEHHLTSLDFTSALRLS